ncbi:hypothetical protein O7634_11955 [Micromonospora sp. WMMD1120]|uniref:hypothetical protein n=1 Tax=Micromonospora sp. WMMD1120 TaxID=3016106 RepID=UPI0024167A26|nr:hypothetical protein [Micromonospora sp. WMMD1120]MDG4807464.1 hypothetical protein [Micromonospora sp. WMMD1120]
MSSAVSARPARWAALRSLRELTRLAITALVLAVGLGAALAATPPPAPTPLRPSAVSSQVATVRPDAGPATERAGRPAVAPPSESSHTTTAVVAITVDPGHAPAIEPGRAAPARRGPPTR